MRGFLQNTCLKQNYSLRNQLLLSFGSAAFITFSAICLISILMLNASGDLVRDEAIEIMREKVHKNIVDATVTMSSIVDQFILNQETIVKLLEEATLDRIVGYPEEGWETDRFVPFKDLESGENVYPLRGNPLPLDWEIVPDVTAEKIEELLPHRASWLPEAKRVSSFSTGSYVMPGACDPNERNPKSFTYRFNCTEENNDIDRGGVYPTETNKHLHRKAAELAILMRPLFESHWDALSLGIYFHNQGAGSVVFYPAHIRNGQSVYKSAGCDWMRAINPHNGKPYGTEKEIGRCRPIGTEVNGRDFNPNEQEWFQDSVRRRGQVHWWGPSKDAIYIVSKALFDRKTGYLIGVVGVHVTVTDMSANLKALRLFNESSHVGMLDASGPEILFADSDGSLDKNGTNVTWTALGILSEACFDSIRETFEDAVASKWNQSSMIDASLRSLQKCPYGIAAAYPIPVPSEPYDPEYFPAWLLVQVVRESEAYRPITEFKDSLNRSILESHISTLVLGAFGMAAILTIIWFVSRILTRPLNWMEEVSSKIVKNRADSSPDHIKKSRDNAQLMQCSPKTEIAQLVEEFRFMIHGFSGEGPCSAAETEFREVQNLLLWQSEFGQLYTREDSDVEDLMAVRASFRQRPTQETKEKLLSELSGLSGGTKETDLEESAETREETRVVPNLPTENVRRSLPTIFPAPSLKHLGPNSIGSIHDNKFDIHRETNVRKSQLFRWIYCLLVIPLILTNGAIFVHTLDHMFRDVPRWLDDLEDDFFVLGMRTMKLLAKAKAQELSMKLQLHIRDLHWITRMAGWLHFGAVPRSDSFSEIVSPTEECKVHDPGTCPSSDIPACVCRWRDIFATDTCLRHDGLESRRHQKLHYICSQISADPLTGERSSMVSAFSSGEATSPITTSWWSDPLKLPGSFKGSNASGFETTYDRIRVSSALAVVEIPLYNYLERQKQQIGTYVAFESDGLIAGFAGCIDVFSVSAHFESNDQNQAYFINEELCPKGMFGYDPRCRAWYKNTKDLYDQGKTVHITGPYQYAIADETLIGLSAASPIANYRTREFIGEVLVDFLPIFLLKSFDTVIGHVSFLLLPDNHQFNGDTMVGVNKTNPLKPTRIAEELFLYDDLDSSHPMYFEETILPRIRGGEDGQMHFQRTGEDGKTEDFIGHFSPVKVPVLSAIDPSDYSTGTRLSEEMAYAVAIGCVEQNMREPFDKAAADFEEKLKILAIAGAVLIAVISVIFLLVASQIAVLVSRPMIILLRAVQRINAKGQQGEIPPLHGGSSEVHQVFNSFSKLYKVIRLSNSAFFAGNMFDAHTMIEDALQLFVAIDDKKAIGVAQNNMGNTLFGMIVQLGEESETVRTCGYVSRAIDCYNKAILASEDNFRTANSNHLKAAYATELADRLFNRGLFLLFIDRVPGAPENAREQGLADISQARDLDYDVIEYWLATKLLLKHSVECFSRMLRRLNGLCDKLDDEDVVRVWDVNELVNEADKLLFAAWGEADAPLFCEMTRTGRLQQLEAAVIRLESHRGNNFQAARHAMRMFSEDEFILEGSFATAACSLVQYSRECSEPAWHQTTLASLHSGLQNMVRSCRTPFSNFGKCVIFAFEMNERWECDGTLAQVSKYCMNLYDRHCFDHDQFGVVAYTATGDHTRPLSPKGELREEQRATLERASTTGSERACQSLPYASQMLMDTCLIDEMDAYIIILTDGESWEPDAFATIRRQFERMNEERNYNVNILILGFEVEDPAVIDDCVSMCSISRGSYYVEVSQENMDDTFADIASTFSTGRLHQRILNSITVQKF